jgi:hypothetical protein
MPHFLGESSAVISKKMSRYPSVNQADLKGTLRSNTRNLLDFNASTTLSHCKSNNYGLTSNPVKDVGIAIGFEN